MPTPVDITYFATPFAFREWLEAHHAEAQELWVGFYKKGSGRASITWPESVDEALCVGWIDGIRKTVDGDSYTIRFTPRKPQSSWSAVNIKRVEELIDAGRMRPAGLAAFEKHKDEKSAIHAYEQRGGATLEPAQEQQFRANQAAWEFFQAQPAWYRRTCNYWVISAKKEETRLKRLATLIEDSANGRTIGPLTRSPGGNGAE